MSRITASFGGLGLSGCKRGVLHLLTTPSDHAHPRPAAPLVMIWGRGDMSAGGRVRPTAGSMSEGVPLAELLGGLVAARSDVLLSMGSGHYESAVDAGETALRDFGGQLSREPDDVHLVPHLTQLIGLLGDIATAEISRGDYGRAQEILASSGELHDRLDPLVSHLTYLGLGYCKDGLPTLNPPACQQQPPCE